MSDRDVQQMPARMLNQFAYCPRLFYYEFVEGVFVDNVHTVEGSLAHQPQDRPGYRTVEGESASEERIQTRSLTLGSDRLALIAKLDVAEGAPDGWHAPIEYKHGRPPDGESDRTWAGAWVNDVLQLGVQMLLLEEHGMACGQGHLYYRETRQRVTIPFTDGLKTLVLDHLEQAWSTAQNDQIPPPLIGDPRCSGCSLVSVCMPEETAYLQTKGATEAEEGLRRLIPARDDEGVLYVNTQGAVVGKSGQVVTVKEKGKLIAEVPMGRIRQLCLMGGVQITSQAVQTLIDEGIPIVHLSMNGRFNGLTTGLPAKNAMLRYRQYTQFSDPMRALPLARKTVAAKIANQRNLLLRNHKEGADEATDRMKELLQRADEAGNLEELLGIEGMAARHYFAQFAGMLKGTEFQFDGRNRRPPRDPINALLSFGYALLVKDLTVATFQVGFDPFFGYLHQPRHGKPALALDLMEEFRPIIVDSVVVTLVNNRMLTESDFYVTPGGCTLTQPGRRRFLDAYERRKETLVTHPLFGYRMSYNRMFEVQARLLLRVLYGELPAYVGFVTR